jgi:hypothetical protein
LTERQLFGVVVRGLGVWFAAFGVEKIWGVILLSFSKYANEAGNYPFVDTAVIALIWLAVSYVLIRRSDVVIELAYGQRNRQQPSAN